MKKFTGLLKTVASNEAEPPWVIISTPLKEPTTWAYNMGTHVAIPIMNLFVCITVLPYGICVSYFSYECFFRTVFEYSIGLLGDQGMLTTGILSWYTWIGSFLTIRRDHEWMAISKTLITPQKVQ